MAGRFLGTRGRLVAFVTVAASIVIVAAGVSATYAQDAQVDDEQLIIDLGGKVYAETCDPCHGNIADTKNFAGEIIFEHGYHQLVSCSSCHSRFPHRQEGTERPTMKACWNCHGLQHGPMGELATGKCPDCHNTPERNLRPAFHSSDWAGKPHVEPGRANLQTQCMMCHDEPWCVDCHDDEGIRWDPGVSYTYDSSNGCMACHGQELLKAAAGGSKSYQVVGVDESAHRDLTCQTCHIDYEYEETADPTPVWTVNVGLACQNCHDHSEVKDVYLQSVHGEELAKANYETATCASCHGGHYIQRLDTEYAQETLHLSAYRICARCHPDKYESYNDYYHGAAYKNGSTDAPACWDCHGAHDALPTADPESKLSDQNAASTCGQEGCHDGSAETFVQNAGDLIHQKNEAVESNPLKRFLDRIISWVT
ncbi:MAG: cytochrome c3 family protein [Coriobacteriia bacterium]|nr:cytochrome c3 family protein [Coriobacteriia bacterium]